MSTPSEARPQSARARAWAVASAVCLLVLATLVLLTGFIVGGAGIDVLWLTVPFAAVQGVTALLVIGSSDRHAPLAAAVTVSVVSVGLAVLGFLTSSPEFYFGLGGIALLAAAAGLAAIKALSQRRVA